MAIVIVKNTTGSSVFIDDLGISVDPSGQLNLSELFSFEDISSSADLKTFVTDGTFTVNDGIDDLNISNGLKHVYHQTVYEDSFEDGGGTLISEQLHVVQVRRTTNLSLSTSWQNVTFDATDIENNTDVIEHSNIDADRILIKDEGYYLLQYSFSVRSSGSTRDCLSRIIKNDNSSEVLSGSYVLQNLYRDETHQQVNSIISYLNNTDYITLQVLASSTPIQTFGDYVLNVTKLEGIRGPKGDDGEPGSILGTLDLPAIQIRRTSSLNIPLSYTNITFDTTDFEPFPSKIEHNNTNTDRIEIKEDGNYLIIYSYEVDDEAYTRVRLNNSSTIIGSERHQGHVNQEDDLGAVVEHTCLVNLTAGDFLTLQVYSTTSSEVLFTSTFIVIKLEGISGEKGDTGDTGPIGPPGPPGEASSINSSGDLDEAKVLDIETNSGASPIELYFYLVQSDIRSNQSLPVGISGDMSTHVIMYDGSTWSDIGAFVGIKGDTGDTGPIGPPGADGVDGVDGQSVKVQFNNSDIMSDVAIMNFSGNALVTTSPGSKVNIAIGETNICQVYDSAGGTDVNNSTPTALPFNQQAYKDSYYIHSTSGDNTRVQVTTSGIYKIGYTMCCDGATGRRTIHSYIRKNGTTKLITSDSYCYTRNTTDESCSNHALFFATLNTGEYIQLMNEQDGSSGSSYAIANQSWLTLEFIRGV